MKIKLLGLNRFEEQLILAGRRAAIPHFEGKRRTPAGSDKKICQLVQQEGKTIPEKNPDARRGKLRAGGPRIGVRREADMPDNIFDVLQFPVSGVAVGE